MTQAKSAENCGRFFADFGDGLLALLARFLSGRRCSGIAGRIFPAMLMAGGRETA